MHGLIFWLVNLKPGGIRVVGPGHIRTCGWNRRGRGEAVGWLWSPECTAAEKRECVCVSERVREREKE